MQPQWRPIRWQIIDGQTLKTPPRTATVSTLQPDTGCVPVACRDCGVYRLCAALGLEGDELSLLERVVRRKLIVKRGGLLFRVREPADYVYAIRSGSVKTCVRTERGRVQITGLHLPGELLGLAGFDLREYTCEARALETTSVCQVSMHQLEEVAQRVPAIHREMLCIMSGQIRHYEQLLLLLGKHNAERRLAAFLLGLSQRFALHNYSPTRFNLSMSRGDIGNYLGIAEETVCRVFTRFQEEGLLTTRRRYVELHDLERLRAIAHDPGRRAATAAALTSVA
jgi:CRP/FNR family transcriptional regulator, anaerobic regulatory protein